MSSFIIASVPIHGHVTPLLAIARQLVSRGDRVRFITGGRFAESVTATGATHIALPPEADFDDREDFNVAFPGRDQVKGTKALAFDIEHIFVRPSRPQYDAVMAAYRAERADAVITDPAFGGGAFVLGHARAERPTVVVAGVLPMSLASRDVAPYGMGLAPWRFGPLNRVRNRVLAGMATRVLGRANAIADELFTAVHGRSIGYPILDWARHADALIQGTVAEFEYPRSDAPPTVHFAGPISASGSVAPRPEWWADLDGARRVVHVTQGTIANKDFTQLIGTTLDALAGEEVLVVVSTGGRPLDALPRLPANARAARYLNYDELLPRTDVFVTNGGYGGVQYALKYGVPIVVTGGQEDKPEVGARVAWSGVGRRFRTERPSPAAVRRAVRRVLSNPSYRATSRAIAHRMAEAPGVEGFCRILDDVIDMDPDHDHHPALT
jgi:MGT family glycosyltransferase